MAFAHSGRADEEHVAAGVEKAAGGQFVDAAALDLGVEGEVEVLEGFQLAEAGGLGAPGDFALAADVEFVGEDEFQELVVAEVVATGFLEAHLEALQQPRETQLAGLAGEGGVHGRVAWCG